MFVAEILKQPWVAVILEAREMMEADVPPAAVVRIIAGENIQQRRDCRLQDVASPARVDLQARAVGPHAGDATTAKLHFPPIRALRLHVAEVPACDVKPAVYPQLDAVRRVVGGAIFETERDVFHQHHLAVTHAVAVIINERAEVRRMHAIDRVPIHHQPARRVHILHKFLHLIRAPIAVRIPQAQDATAARLAIQRAIAIARNVERAVRRGGDKDRVVRLRRRGEKRGLKAFRHLHILEQLRLFRKRRSGECGHSEQSGENEETSLHGK